MQRRQQDKPQNNYDSLVALTGFRELSLLRTGLLQSVQNICEQSVIRIFSYKHDNDRHWQLQDSTEPDTLIDVSQTDIDALNLALQETVVSCFVNNTQQYFFPVKQQGQAIAVMDISADSLNVSCCGQISALNAIYANQLYWLDRCSHDQLTNLLNRHAFDDKLSQYSLSTTSSDSESLDFLAMVDIDFFKKINDSFGHLYGDEVLVLLAQKMTRLFRDTDWLFRFGGEEFVVIVRGISVDNAQNLFTRLCQSIESEPFPQVGKVTVSVGYSELNNDQPITSILSNADTALYFSKDNGRNQSNYYEQLVVEGRLNQQVTPSGDIDLF